MLRPVLAEARSDAIRYETQAERFQARIDSGEVSSVRAHGQTAEYSREVGEGCRRAADLIRDTPPEELPDRLAELRSEYSPPGAYNYIGSYAQMLRGVKPPSPRFYADPDEAEVTELRMARTAAVARDDAVMQPPHGPGTVKPGSPLYLDPEALNEAADIIESSTPDNVAARLEGLRSELRSQEARRFVTDYINEVQGMRPEYNGPDDS